MNQFFVNLVIVAVLTEVCYAAVTPVQQCQDHKFEDLEERIQVVPCDKSMCRLRRESNVTVSFRFKPNKEVKSLTNEVYANVVGIPFPFLGTTGTNACNDVQYADSGKPAACPLEPGIEYVYNNVFYIYPIYPITKLVVYWSLNDGNDKVICFQVPAAIVAAKKKI